MRRGAAACDLHHDKGLCFVSNATNKYPLNHGTKKSAQNQSVLSKGAYI